MTSNHPTSTLHRRRTRKVLFHFYEATAALDENITIFVADYVDNDDAAICDSNATTIDPDDIPTDARMDEQEEFSPEEGPADMEA